MDPVFLFVYPNKSELNKRTNSGFFFQSTGFLWVYAHIMTIIIIFSRYIRKGPEFATLYVFKKIYYAVNAD